MIKDIHSSNEESVPIKHHWYTLYIFNSKIQDNAIMLEQILSITSRVAT